MIPSPPVSFSFPTSIRFGEGVIAELSAYLLQHAWSRPLLVSDPQVGQLPFFQQILQHLESAGLQPILFTDIHANPVKADVLAGGKRFHEAQCDCIVGIGGGAAMDVARAIVLHVFHPRDLFDYDDLIGGAVFITERVPPFVTVPTTSGTGSEVGRSAIISEDESRKKRILFSPKLMARQVFADPALTYELPAHVTAATGMDALTHNLEAFLAKNYHPLADGLALEGMRLIWRAIREAVHTPTPRVRAEMMMGSMMGAIAFQKGLGVVHSLAHPLSTLLDLHHGLANAIVLPHGMAFNYAGQEAAFARIAQQFGLGSTEAIVPAIHALVAELGLPTRLRDCGVEKQKLDTLSELAIADFAHPNNPKPVTQADFRMLYEQAW